MHRQVLSVRFVLFLIPVCVHRVVVATTGHGSPVCFGGAVELCSTVSLPGKWSLASCTVGVCVLDVESDGL